MRTINPKELENVTGGMFRFGAKKAAAPQPPPPQPPQPQLTVNGSPVSNGSNINLGGDSGDGSSGQPQVTYG